MENGNVAGSLNLRSHRSTILWLREGGMSYAAIGSIFNASGVWVRAVAKRLSAPTQQCESCKTNTSRVNELGTPMCEVCEDAIAELPVAMPYEMQSIEAA